MEKTASLRRDLTTGPVAKTMLLFSLPLIAGDILQQLYNVADTLIVGRFLGSAALGAVGSAYTLMTFLTSILLGLALGSGAVFSVEWGRRDLEELRRSVFSSFCLIALITAALTAFSFAFLDGILRFLQVPAENYALMRAYLWVIFLGIPATFLYNFFACLVRAVGDSAAPLVFLGLSAAVNIALDLWFVVGLGWGVEGAAAATVIAQYLSGGAMAAYTALRWPQLLPGRRQWELRRENLARIARFSLLTCAQQSVMNFGILLVQGRVNSFGPAVMAAFAAGVKIDAFAYMPVQDFGNAFSTFVSQNYGAGKFQRIREGARRALILSASFSLAISALVILLARPLMLLFVQPQETQILAHGVTYLRIEGAFYWGIGCLFLLYGFFRAVKQPAVSVLLTCVSLGLRVALAYLLAGPVGVTGIWASVPIGWVLADATGLLFYRRWKRQTCPPAPPSQP